MNNEAVLITPAEAQELLGVGRNTIYNLLGDKEFPAFKIGTRYFVNKLKLQDWADKMCKIK